MGVVEDDTLTESTADGSAGQIEYHRKHTMARMGGAQAAFFLMLLFGILGH